MTINEEFQKWRGTADSVSPTITIDMDNARLAFDAGWNEAWESRNEEVRELKRRNGILRDALEKGTLLAKNIVTIQDKADKKITKEPK